MKSPKLSNDKMVELESHSINQDEHHETVLLQPISSESPRTHETHLWQALLEHLRHNDKKTQQPNQLNEDEHDKELHEAQGHVLSHLLKSHFLHPWENASGVAPHKSNIVKGPFHLSKYSRAKDVIVSFI